MREKDLRLAAQKVHRKPDVRGNARDRETFFDFETSKAEKGKVSIAHSVRLNNGGGHKKRIPILIPEKLREQMRELLGVDSDEEYYVSTTLMALADYACKVIREEKRSVTITKA